MGFTAAHKAITPNAMDLGGGRAVEQWLRTTLLDDEDESCDGCNTKLQVIPFVYLRPQPF